MNFTSIDYQTWQTITYRKAEEIFFAQPLFRPLPPPSGLGVYGFFVIKSGREYLCYIGRSFDLFTRLRSPWYHKHWFFADAVRVLAFPIWQTPQIRDWADYINWIELFEYYMILTYKPPRNRQWARWGSPHEYCINGRRINPNLNHRISPLKEIRSRWRDSFDTRLQLGKVPVQDGFLIRYLPEDGARFLPEDASPLL